MRFRTTLNGKRFEGAPSLPRPLRQGWEPLPPTPNRDEYKWKPASRCAVGKCYCCGSASHPSAKNAEGWGTRPEQVGVGWAWPMDRYGDTLCFFNMTPSRLPLVSPCLGSGTSGIFLLLPLPLIAMDGVKMLLPFLHNRRFKSDNSLRVGEVRRVRKPCFAGRTLKLLKLRSGYGLKFCLWHEAQRLL